MMPGKTVLSALILFFALYGTAVSSTDNFADIITRMRSSASQIKDMKCLFSKKIVKNGESFPETTMEFKYLKSPESLFVEFINRFKGQKCLYVRGQNEGKMAVKPAGLLGIMKLNIDPNGDLAMEESLDPITGMDFASTITTFENLLKKNSANPDAKAEFIRNINEGNQKFHMIKCYSASDSNSYFHMYIDQESYLPRKIHYKAGNNMATYVYSNVSINCGLGEKDITLD